MKNHSDTHTGHGHHTHSAETNRLKLTIVIILNLIITGAEYAGGIISGSLALMSDAGHNLSDVLSLMLGYAGERASEKDTSARYTFGFKRIEVLVAFFNALTLVAIGVYILYEAVMRFIHPEPINIRIMVPVAAIGLFGNLFSIIILHANRKSNLNMKAAFLHLFYDTVSSVAVIGAGIVIFFSSSLIWIDIIISIFIVMMIVWSSLDIIRESIRIFLQGAPAYIDPDEIYKSIHDMDGVTNVHGLHVWSINSNEVFLSCHICADESDTDGVINRVNHMLDEKFKIRHTTIQVETELLCDTETGICCR